MTLKKPINGEKRAEKKNSYNTVILLAASKMR